MVRLDTCMPFPYSIRDFCSGEVTLSSCLGRVEGNVVGGVAWCMRGSDCFVLIYVFCTVGLPSLLFCE